MSTWIVVLAAILLVTLAGLWLRRWVAAFDEEEREHRAAEQAADTKAMHDLIAGGMAPGAAYQEVRRWGGSPDLMALLDAEDARQARVWEEQTVEFHRLVEAALARDT